MNSHKMSLSIAIAQQKHISVLNVFLSEIFANKAFVWKANKFREFRAKAS